MNDQVPDGCQHARKPVKGKCTSALKIGGKIQARNLDFKSQKDIETKSKYLSCSTEKMLKRRVTVNLCGALSVQFPSMTVLQNTVYKVETNVHRIKK